MMNSSWKYLDSPWDLLRDCQQQPQTSDSRLFCILSTILGFLSAYLFPLTSTFTIAANISTVVIFTCKYRKSSRPTIYYTFLALADILHNVFYGWFWIFPAKGLPYASNGRIYFFSFNVNNFICKWHRFFNILTGTLSSGFICLAAFDRCLAMYFPFKFAKLKPKIAIISSCVLILLSVVASSPYYFLVDHYTNENNGGLIGCWLIIDSLAVQILEKVFLNAGIFHVIFLVICNIALLIKLHQARLNRAALSNREMKISKKEITATITILLLSFIFCTCSLPMNIIFILAFFTDRFAADKSPLRFYYNIGDNFWILYFIQEGLNWFIYMIQMEEFRNRMLCRKQYKRESSYASST